MMILAWLAGLVAAAGAAALGGVLSDEARARLEQLPALLLVAAVRRLPLEIRRDVGEEWRAELDHILHRFEAYPLTRLLSGIRFAAGLLWAAPRIGDDLISVRGEVPAQVQHELHLKRLRSHVTLAGVGRFTNWLFLEDDEEAYWRGWQMERRRAGLARTYRDPRFNRKLRKYAES